MNWKIMTQLRTVKSFVEGSVFADAVAACERAQSTTPFKWNGGKKTAVVGLTSVKPNKDTVIASYTLVADSVFCDYDPIKKKADIGSNFLEREEARAHLQRAGMSPEATRNIELYQRKALEWVRNRERPGELFEKSWLDRFRALLPSA